MSVLPSVRRYLPSFPPSVRRYLRPFRRYVVAFLPSVGTSLCSFLPSFRRYLVAFRLGASSGHNFFTSERYAVLVVFVLIHTLLPFVFRSRRFRRAVVVMVSCVRSGRDSADAEGELLRQGVLPPGNCFRDGPFPRRGGGHRRNHAGVFVAGLSRTLDYSSTVV